MPYRRQILQVLVSHAVHALAILQPKVLPMNTRLSALVLGVLIGLPGPVVAFGPPDLDEEFVNGDGDKDGLLSVGEFTVITRSVIDDMPGFLRKKITKKPEDWQLSAEQAFAAADLDHSQSLTRDEFTKAFRLHLRDLGLNPPDEE
jgi:hypothetical protein